MMIVIGSWSWKADGTIVNLHTYGCPTRVHFFNCFQFRNSPEVKAFREMERSLMDCIRWWIPLQFINDMEYLQKLRIIWNGYISWKRWKIEGIKIENETSSRWLKWKPQMEWIGQKTSQVLNCPMKQICNRIEV